jgi:nucleotide-binding universal stress UspA family protein
MHYLVAVDGSEPSTDALEYAIDLAANANGSLTVAHSVEPRILVEGGNNAPTYPDADDVLYTEDISEAENRAERVLDEAEERVREAGISVESALLYGDPVETIPAYATTEGIDLIVVGHRGLTQRVEDLVGSVAEGLVQHSPIPVAVVK